MALAGLVSAHRRVQLSLWVTIEDAFGSQAALTRLKLRGGQQAADLARQAIDLVEDERRAKLRSADHVLTTRSGSTGRFVPGDWD
jgi:hypothetical protein